MASIGSIFLFKLFQLQFKTILTRNVIGIHSRNKFIFAMLDAFSQS